jgi:hypothetical protein
VILRFSVTALDNCRNQAITRFDRWSLSEMAICTKPLARRTLRVFESPAVGEGLK